jgi:hypothetical protein
MNLSSSSNYFHTKNPFSISFIQIKWVMDWASIIKERRVPGAKNTETQNPGIWTAGWFLGSSGTL